MAADGRQSKRFRVATGLTDEPFISHFAIRIFQRLGFVTSPLPDDSTPVTAPAQKERQIRQPLLTDDDSLAAYRRLDAFVSTNPLTRALADLEASLLGADRSKAHAIVAASGFDDDLIDSALVVRERVGMLDSLIHAAVITHVIPLILEEHEQVLKRPSLGAGNDPARIYDLETTHRLAEFKLSSWKGADSMPQCGLFADVVGLPLDTTDRRRQVYVVGTFPSAS